MARIQFIQAKKHKLADAQRIINSWKMKGDTIVFTNGCFDILHKGHVSYLAKAADLGHRLVIGLNSDESVRRQGKSPERPINDLEARNTVLSALGFVDMVVVFDTDTPQHEIEFLAPNVLVKGADYDSEETDSSSEKYIVGSDSVRKNGGKVVTIELEAGFSTTDLIQKLKA